jgi:hypothetical protein
MERRALTFWGSALGVAMALAGLIPVLFPFRQLGLVTPEDRARVWLLSVFTAGVMAILFGVAAWVAGPKMISLRDVVESGGVDQARAAREKADKARGERTSYGNPAAWAVALGGFLIGIYFLLWILRA